MTFVPLQVMSYYSLLQSTIGLPDLVTTAKKNGYQAIALTDHNVLYGAVDFYKLCQANQIKPLIGLTLDIYGLVHTERIFQVVLLAKNLQGYRHLMMISSLRTLEERKMGVQLTEIQAYLADLIVILPADSQSEVVWSLLNEQTEIAEEVTEKWQQVVAPADLYLGLSLRPGVQTIQESYQTLAKKLSISLVSLDEVAYLQSSDALHLTVLEHIREGTKLTDLTEQASSYAVFPSQEYTINSYQDAGFGEAIEATKVIAEKCQVEIPLHQKLLPQFPVSGEQSAVDYLRALCEKGLTERIITVDEVYQARLVEELSVIHEMGFDDYFLIVWDVMRYAHEAKIVTGAGRGSAAGSLVAYVLYITDVDPIEYDLLFERFLNKERYNMPDIDLDLPDNRREEVLQYVANKYGENHVAQIATFGTLAAKMAIRDVARVFGLSQTEANQWSNAIPKTLKITLSDAYKESKKLQQLVAASEKNQRLFEAAKAIEGFPRHVSTHAAGVVISDQPLTNYVPLQVGSEHIPLTQFTMGDIEEIGLLKMDFLGLRNLSILDQTLTNLKRDGQEIVPLNQLPLDDEETLALFRRGETNGVFQFESSGIQNVLRKLGPTSLEDIAAVNALYRPGPMQNIDLFIARKKGKVPIEYPHPDLRPILEKTYGVMVYQEQVMQVASKMAGFSLGEADILRRAIGKKQKDMLDKERQHFITGAIQNGYSEAVATQVYDYIERFADYGFNRSHAVAYAMIAYQMAYLKVHATTAFFAALLNSVRSHPSKLKSYILEAKKYKLTILPPHINESFYGFSLQKQQIQFGLGNIKGVRNDLVHEIIQERKNHGLFKDVVQFLQRLQPKWLKEEYLLPLVYAGAFDHFGYHRGELAVSLPSLLESIKMSGNNVALFDILQPKMIAAPDLTTEERLAKEEEVLGVYLSGHPTEKYDAWREKLQVSYLADAIENQKATFIVAVKQIKKIRTKKGEQMAFITVNDVSGETSVTVFPNLYRQLVQWLTKDSILLVYGKAETGYQAETIQLVAERIAPADEAVQQYEVNHQPTETLFIRLADDSIEQPEILTILEKFPGKMPVILVEQTTHQKIILPQKYWVTFNDELQKELSGRIKDENVATQKINYPNKN